MQYCKTIQELAGSDKLSDIIDTKYVYTEEHAIYLWKEPEVIKDRLLYAAVEKSIHPVKSFFIIYSYKLLAVVVMILTLILFITFIFVGYISITNSFSIGTFYPIFAEILVIITLSIFHKSIMKIYSKYLPYQYQSSNDIGRFIVNNK